MSLSSVWTRMSGYFDHPDPRLAVGGAVALIVVGNQPFYPFYVWWVVGHMAGPAFLTWLSMPVFLLAPALARRAPDVGRSALLSAAIGNTLLSAKALGPGSGVEVFALPCLLLAWVVSPPGRRLPTAIVSAIVMAAGLAVIRIDGRPLATLDAAQDHALTVMHGISVACLMVVMVFAALRAEAHVSRSGASPHP